MRLRIIIVLSGTALLVAACGAGTRTTGRLDVVASTNVYGDIAAQIGGRHVAVTSVLSDPNADPHLFEPGTSNGLAVAQARLVIQNGLGYDAFMQKLEDAAPSRGRVVVTIADALGVHGTSANPHLWYDVPRLGAVAEAVATGLEKADPENAAAYGAGLRRFVASLAPLRAEVARIRARFGGAPVAYTEPVPGYLVAAAGLTNLAPDSFTRALEAGSEPPPSAVAAMTTLLAKRAARVLLYNEQAVSPITALLLDTAHGAGVAVVPVTETLPARLTFQRWQLDQAKALEAALAR